MFAKIHTPLPLLKSFDIGDLRFDDLAGVRERRVLEVNKAWKILERLTKEYRPDAVMCSNDNSLLSEYSNAFLAWEKDNPTKTTDDFDLIYDPDWTDSQHDTRKGHVTWLVSEKDEVAGIFAIYNVDILSQDRDSVEISGNPAPAFHSSLGELEEGQVADVMEYLLEENLELQAGGFLALVEWRFPTCEQMSWRDDNPPYVKVTIDRLGSNHTMKYEDTSSGLVPQSVRRT